MRGRLRRGALIALTGGIGTGKSTVAGMLAEHGAAIVDADALAREVVEPGTPGLAAVLDAFGPDVRDASGGLDRERLGALVFADAERRHALEAIVHPLVRARSAEMVAAAAASDPPLIAVDIPLLFETGREGDFPDGVLLVYADPATQLRRLRDRTGLDEASVLQRIAAQLPIDVKRGRATWVIDNGGSREATQAEVERWWQGTVGD
jgi:dephospho-CoA kinase